MKKLLTIATTLLLSTGAMAATYHDVTTHQNAQFVTEFATTEADALAQGNEFLDELNASTNIELSQTLPTPHSRIDKRSVELDNTEINVIADEAEDGTVSYRALIDIEYSYDYRKADS